MERGGVCVDGRRPELVKKENVECSRVRKPVALGVRARVQFAHRLPPQAETVERGGGSVL